MSSLSGQNNQGRLSRARSSRASSTIFSKLRKLDRQISYLDKRLSYTFSVYERKAILAKRDSLDEKRKLARNKRKGYTI